MAWYYQTSPRDMHDWDSAQTPVLIDGTINGRPRKLVSPAARNGYFFTVDRVTGEYIASGKFGTATNWASGLDPQGRPILNPEKVSTIPGAIVSGSITNWPPPAYSPDTGLFYVPENNGLSITYLIDADPRSSMGLGGRQTGGGVSLGNFVTAIDAKKSESGVAAQVDRRRRCDRHVDDGWTAAVFPATVPATSSPSIRRTAVRCVTRESGTSRTRPRPTSWTASNICWLPPAMRSSPSRLLIEGR